MFYHYSLGRTVVVCTLYRTLRINWFEHKFERGKKMSKASRKVLLGFVDEHIESESCSDDAYTINKIGGLSVS